MPRTVLLFAFLGILLAACSPTPDEAPSSPSAAQLQPSETADTAKPVRIGVMPKLVGIDYFNAAEKGALEAAQELGIEVVYDGPVTNDVTKQAEMLETWIAKKFDAICIAPNDPEALAPVLKKARKRGIKVLTWDADALPEARDYFVNQCTAEAIAKSLMDLMTGGAGPQAKYIILTGSLTAANQNIWMDEMEKYRQATYPKMTNLSATPKASEEDQALATQVTTDCLKTYPDLEGIFAITSVALPGAAEALRKADAANQVFLTGLATPRMMREYVEDGTVKQFVLWSPVDLGYLAVYAAYASANNNIPDGATTLDAGRLGTIEIADDAILLGPPLVFDKENIGDYAF